ncbi:hypothetical protein GBAR_LOCUS30063 [Geodia barretti]|uniref:Uncharacterized protein n=1 Tax=Geodia barretti TaxID=519541 RepID=A0AA35XKB4_GEOBA|nr:hypothetical protein GBAR_LOCUS30063 [Geodia barretti]
MAQYNDRWSSQAFILGNKQTSERQALSLAVSCPTHELHKLRP